MWYFHRSLTLIEVSLSATRQTLRETLDNSAEAAQARLTDLTKSQQILEECWRPLRWLHDVISSGRSRDGVMGVSVARLRRWTSNNDDNVMMETTTTARPVLQDQTTVVQQLTAAGPPQQLSTTAAALSSNKSLPSSLSSSPAPLSIPEDGTHLQQNLNRGGSYNSTNSQHKNSDIKQRSTSSIPSSSETTNNVLQIFAAYECGLANGTSVIINLTQATTAREVVDLVVKQLNMAVIMKGRPGPVYDSEQLKNFCLVAVIGNRERCLRDDFKPLHLQNPWKRGKLFVRVKNDVLAALECTNENAIPISASQDATTAVL